MQKQVMSLFSKTFAGLLTSVSSCEKDLLVISVDVSYESVSNVVTVLRNGEAAIANEEDLLDMVEAAELFGIDMENSEVVFKKTLEALRLSNSKKRKTLETKCDSFEGFTFIKEEEDHQHMKNDLTGDNSNEMYKEEFEGTYFTLKEKGMCTNKNYPN